MILFTFYNSPAFFSEEFTKSLVKRILSYMSRKLELYHVPEELSYLITSYIRKISIWEERTDFSQYGGYMGYCLRTGNIYKVP